MIAALVAASCARGPDPIHVTAIRLADGTPSDALREAGLDEAALDSAARAGLSGAGFTLGEGARPHHAVVDVPSVRVLPGAAGPRLEVTVEIDLTPAEPGAKGGSRRETASASVALASAAAPRDAWRDALVQAAQRSAEGLGLGVDAERKGVAALVADLTAKDTRIREQAVRVLGERKARAAVPALVERLKEEDPRLARRIVGALVQIGDERAVPALIDLARGADATVTGRIVRFVGDIGGPEAEGFLLTIASGHPDARVRKAAREALDDLAARAKDASIAARR
ncbi:MAG TPA: HEAT repeat domain-containing protein [Anaeromyxobacter sp.]